MNAKNLTIELQCGLYLSSKDKERKPSFCLIAGR